MASDGIETKIAVGLGPEVDLTDETAAQVIEMSGVIKWFDVAKGYGFIVPDNGMGDVLLHVTCLRRDGYQTAYEGARVVCEVLARPKGLQAFRIITMDEFDGDSSGADAAAADPCYRGSNKRSRTGAGEMVQSASRVRLRHARGGDARYLRPYGNPAPIRDHRIAAGAIRSGPLRPRSQGIDGRRSSPRERTARPVVALERIPIWLNRAVLSILAWSRVLFGKPVSTPDQIRGRLFPGHALTAAVASTPRWSVRLAASLFATLAACLLLGAAAPAAAAGQSTIEIVSKSGVHAFSVELASNDAERERGLMFRKELPEGTGMLFDFEREAPVAFWMHNTFIPLDMIFIRADGSILRIAENAEPLSDRLIPSGGPVRAVLEVIGGTARKLGIAPGDRVESPIFKNSH